MSELPTVEECREFLRVINEGRALIDLPALDVLDFDGAVCDDLTNCLSARNLFALAGYNVLETYIDPSWGGSIPDDRVCGILGEDRRIPPSIRCVTDVFDRADGLFARAMLRARLVEAGVVAP